jgi:hypothetical protein
MKALNILVSYVIREEDGASPAKEFVGSLRKFPAGAPATLLVSVKCQKSIFLDQIRGIFEDGVKGFDIDVVHAPNHGFDLGTHYLVARQNPGVILIFMSASSKATCPNWLNLLTLPLIKNHVGAVGCMLSFESIHDSYLEIVRTRIKSKLHLKMSGFELAAAKARGISVSKFQIPFGPLGNWITHLFTKVSCYLLRNRQPLSYSRLFPAFPNPHLRTTGFAVRADLLLVTFDSYPQYKHEAFQYESGYSSISRRIVNLGYQVLHCDYKGIYEDYDQVSKPTSFRVQKGKSIVSDRESRRFHALSPENQVALNKITFGGRD